MTSSPPSAGPGPLRVVVAEDEALIRLDLVEMLTAEGYTVVGEAADGAAAVRLAEELRPDVVLLDVRMPVLDGLAAAERIAAQRLAAVVVLTAYSQRELVERARDAGAMAYLVKPFSAADLVPAVEVARSRYEERRRLEDEVTDLTARLEARKLVERAKGRLMAERGLTEPEAFRVLQRTSMDLRTSMRGVAEAVLAPDDAAPATPPATTPATPPVAAPPDAPPGDPREGDGR